METVVLPVKYRLLAALLVLSVVSAWAAAAAPVAGIVVMMGDQHSAYERTAQFVARVDRVKAENPGVPLVVLIDGDTFEQGNAVARRSAGAVEFAMFAALSRRAPTILNLGNHEPEFYDVAETVRRVEATGIKVVSNLVNRADGRPFAPASVPLKFGSRDAVVVGVTTDNLATFRVAVRPSLDLADPVVWAKKNFPTLLALAPVRIVLSHAGLASDREMLSLVPDGTLFAGAHDHLRFLRRAARTVYVHSGSWNASMTLARLHFETGGTAAWAVEQLPLAAGDPADPELAAVIRETRAKFVTAAETAVVGRNATALAAPDAARFFARAMARAAGADAGFIGNTTFGGDLPAGDVTREAFDACVRFDGTVFTGEVDGAQLRALLAAANQGPDTRWSDRRGDFVFGVGPAGIVADRHYRIAVDNWVARNVRKYLGTDAVKLTEQASLHLKTIAASALTSAP